MSKKSYSHIQHYLPLMSVLLAGVLGFAIFSYDRMFQAAIALAVATSYVAWGVIHHHIHKDLHLTVVVEYVCVAVFGLAAIFSLLF